MKKHTKIAMDKKQFIDLLLNYSDKIIGSGVFGTIDRSMGVNLDGGRLNPMKERISKKEIGANVMLIQNGKPNNYYNKILKQLKKDGFNKFTIKDRSWGQRITGTPIVQYNKQYYLEMLYLYTGKIKYFLDSTIEIKESDIEGLIKPKPLPKNEIRTITINLSSIDKLIMNGRQFIIDH